MGTETLVPVLVALIGGGGLMSGIAVFFKLRPEKDSIVVTAAQGALLIQTSITEQLRLDVTSKAEELERAYRRIKGLEHDLEVRNAEISELRARRDDEQGRGREHRP